MWIAYSLVMFFSSTALYLTVRKSSIEKVPTQLINLAMFAIPFVAISAMGVYSSQKFSVSFSQICLLLLIGVVFSYGGNTASLKAIALAPNPGYSLVLSKSYVVFTTLVSVVFLSAELTLQKSIAIVMIVGFSALIMIDRKSSKSVESSTWLLLSFAAFFAFGFMSLFSRYLFNQGVGTVPFLVYVLVIATLCTIWASRKQLDALKALSKKQWMLIIGTGIFATFFNLGMFQAIKVAPNVGYVNAINASSIALVAILAVILFKDELTTRKAIGVLGVTVGLIILLI